MEPGFSLICLVLLASTTVNGQAINGTTKSPVTNDANSSSKPFALSYTPTKVYQGITENVEVHCKRNTAVESKIEELVWMRILVHTPDDGTRVLAEQREGSTRPNIFGDVRSHGRLAPVEESYLKAVRTKPSDSAIIFYMCFAFGIKKDLSFVVESSSGLLVKAKKLSESDLLDIILDTGKSIRLRANNNSKTISNTARILDAYSQRSEQRFSEANDRLDKANLTVESMMSEFLFPKEEELWPAGTYALIKPESGCPADLAFYEGENGFFRLHTESSTMNPENGYSKNTHLSRPIQTSYSINTFMTFRFCAANGLYGSGAWPKGRYCIHKKGNCPVGFNSGYIHFLTERSGNLDAVGGNTPEQSTRRMYFCCMTTGDPTTPIELPTAHPFYLYQYDGRCQNVKGMRATEEYIQVHTEPGSSTSGYVPYLAYKTPGNIVRLELCYYTKY
ncbi:hypothetical protein EGW08_012458 [Elysia chlorotica]|uniref:Apextrin C-terminal domain-containing protein n=1 Tax=Elysia chlorotica TaxID=188477 RepID=A0A3S1B4M6_ELYCH|nr:hypothetical protein EGW08_012458 [Elysia chlorotica]